MRSGRNSRLSKCSADRRKLPSHGQYNTSKKRTYHGLRAVPHDEAVQIVEASCGCLLSHRKEDRAVVTLGDHLRDLRVCERGEQKQGGVSEDYPAPNSTYFLRNGVERRA